jgi:hypothetical protein
MICELSFFEVASLRGLKGRKLINSFLGLPKTRVIIPSAHRARAAMQSKKPRDIHRKIADQSELETVFEP